MANIRAAYATLVANYLETGSAGTMDVKTAKQADSAWHISNNKLTIMVGSTASDYSLTAKTGDGTYTVAIDSNGSVSVS